MTGLTRREELIMLTIFRLKNEAYLIAIVDHLFEVTGKKMSLTSVHVPLSRLEKAGLIEGEYGESTAVRGGRRKKVYRITKIGYEMLEEHKRLTDVLWADYPKFSTPKEK